MGTTHRERTVPPTGQRGGLVRFLFGGPFRPEPGKKCFIGVKSQGGQVIQREVACFVGIIAGFQAATQHRSMEPDTHRELGGIVGIGGHKDGFADSHFESCFLQQFILSSFDRVTFVRIKPTYWKLPNTLTNGG